MNTADVRPRLLKLLTDIAPDVDPAGVAADAEFSDQFDFDSMDQLNFAIAVNREFGVDIPERDYRELRSLAGAERYLQRAAR